MYKHRYRGRMLRLACNLLIINAMVSGCQVPTQSAEVPTWFSVGEARSEIRDSSRPILAYVKGRFEKNEKGEYVLKSVEDTDGSVVLSNNIVVETDSAKIRKVLTFCLGETVVVTGMLENGDPPVLRATQIDELADIRRIDLGTCDE